MVGSGLAFTPQPAELHFAKFSVGVGVTVGVGVLEGVGVLVAVVVEVGKSGDVAEGTGVGVDAFSSVLTIGVADAPATTAIGRESSAGVVEKNNWVMVPIAKISPIGISAPSKMARSGLIG